MKKIVVLGGGTGLSVLLRGLKQFPLDITAIVTVADDGSSSGRLREEFDIFAVGDLRNVLVSLSEVEPLIEDLLQYRFVTDSSLNNHPMGNLLLTALYNITGNLTESLRSLSKIFNIKGTILPFTEENPVLIAHTTDGKIIEGESNITKAGKEIDYIEYKKSATFKNKILKTVCAFANNYMNREIGLLFIGVEEVNDPKTEEKAIPQRPICGVEESLIESTENSLKQLLANIHPKVSYHLITDIIDDRNYIIVAVEPGTSGPYQTSDKAENDKDISLKAGRYIRVRRDSRLPNFKEEYELLRKFAHDVFSSNLNETATLDDLNYEYIKEYLIATNAREDIRNQSKLDMAKSMGLISESEYGGYRAKNFAVLMFAERPCLLYTFSEPTRPY